MTVVHVYGDCIHFCTFFIHNCLIIIGNIQIYNYKTLSTELKIKESSRIELLNWL